MNAQQSREAFEEWVTSRRGWLAVERLENGSYAWLPTAEAWATWQAGIAWVDGRIGAELRELQGAPEPFDAYLTTSEELSDAQREALRLHAEEIDRQSRGQRRGSFVLADGPIDDSAWARVVATVKGWQSRKT